MATINLTHSSASLGKKTNVSIIVPDNINGNAKVLYLLHGLSDNNCTWLERSSVARYVFGKNLIVVCPDAGKSFYCNLKGGYGYYDYISKELPQYIESLFPISGDRDDRYIAGLSMGGYGAFKIALSNPDRYAGAASFSGVMDVRERVKMKTFDIMGIVEGEGFKDEYDLFYLAQLASKKTQKPKLYQWCGTEDFLYSDNVKFRDFIKNLDFDYTYSESPGDHSWEYWDEQIKKTVDFFGF